MKLREKPVVFSLCFDNFILSRTNGGIFYFPNISTVFLYFFRLIKLSVLPFALGVSLFIVEATAGGVTILDRIEGVESPRGLPLYDVTFNNVILSKSQLLGKSEYACIYGRCDGRNDAS